MLALPCARLKARAESEAAFAVGGYGMGFKTSTVSNASTQ